MEITFHPGEFIRRFMARSKNDRLCLQRSFSKLGKLTLCARKPKYLGVVKEVNKESEVLIWCRDVHKSFGEKQILKGVNFKIRHGEAVRIIGPSGTGKSTILMVMAGLLAPDKGEAFICGKQRHGLVSDEEISRLRIGLRIEDRMPSEPSGGMKKHVALARSIIFDETKEVIQSEVLFLDINQVVLVAPIASTVVEDLIRSVHSSQQDALRQTGKIASYVVVTHQDSTISRAVDRLLFLYEGRIVWEGMAHGFSSTKKILLFDSLHQVAWMVQSNTEAVKIFSWFDDDFLGLPGISFVNKRIQFCRPSIGVGLAGN